MKKINKFMFLAPLIIGSASGLTSCGSKASSEKYTLKVINSEDYIFIDEENPDNDLTEQFKRYVKQLVKDGELDSGYANVDVVYDTSDTNETLYSELQTGKSDYDLINVSDYMVQKMIYDDLIIPLYREGETREDKIPNYEHYASRVIRDRLDSILAPTHKKAENPDTGEMETVYVELKDYAVGYMWGTLGILFNPGYNAYSKYDQNEVINDMAYSYSGLWNKKYNGTISIKNSMRDTFAAGMLHTYEEDFRNLKLQYEEDGDFDKFYADFSDLFNGVRDDKTFSQVVGDVQRELTTLKGNIFGLEVDSGKQDIVTGKIGINLAWSGDAVYAMDQAEDGTLVGENQSELYFSVPELGSNLWFDNWVMPKNANRSEERRELALLFLDFISDPENAMQNMDYTGYTSFIGGDSVLELARDWFDIRTNEIYQEVETQKYVYESYQVYSVNEATEEFAALDYPDCMKNTHDSGKDADTLYYFVPTDELEEPEELNDLLNQNHKVFLLDENEEETDVQKTYGDLLIADSDENYDELAVDLSYFFNDTLSDEYEDDIDTIFYSDSYLYSGYVDEEGNFIEYQTTDPFDESEHDNISVGRQFFTQYPDEATINRCAVMRDFGANNKLVMKMWEEFKSDPLPTPALVIFLVIIGCAIGFVALLLSNKIIVSRIRKKRKAKQNA